MSLNNLGNKQTIVLHNCEINNEAYNLVITPHKQTIGYVRTKSQTIKRKILSKQRQITRKRFSKRRNAVSESEVSNLDALCKLKDTIYKITQFAINYTFPTQKLHHIHQNKEK